MNLREGVRRCALLWLPFVSFAPIALGQCAITPIKPIPPLGCKDLTPQCVTDNSGHASWTWACVSSRSKTDTDNFPSWKSRPQTVEPPIRPNVNTSQTINSDPVTPLQESAAPIDLPIGQLNVDQQYAAEQLRAIAEAIKKCPAGVNPDSDTSTGSHFSAPSNVVWDIERTQSYRSPVTGYIEFISNSAYPLGKPVQCKKNDRKCAAWNQAVAETNLMIAALPTLALTRYEFDFGPHGLEFSRALMKDGNEDASHWQPSQLGTSCEGQSVKSVLTASN
jgi:hypothetical protein